MKCTLGQVREEYQIRCIPQCLRNNQLKPWQKVGSRVRLVLQLVWHPDEVISAGLQCMNSWKGTQECKYEGSVEVKLKSQEYGCPVTLVMKSWKGEWHNLSTNTAHRVGAATQQGQRSWDPEVEWDDGHADRVTQDIRHTREGWMLECMCTTGGRET